MLAAWSCKDNADEVFQASISPDKISFKPIPGGAVMKYTMPNDQSIDAIRVVYTDVMGEQIVKMGSYLGDSIVLGGFNEAKPEVPISISLLDKHGNASAPILKTFSTQTSIPALFFEKMEVESIWDGIQLRYDVPKENATGYAHVFYLGTNKLTNKPDTVLIRTFPISGGGDTINMEIKQIGQTANTVIVRTEDFRGYTVHQEILSNLPAYASEKMAYKTDFEFEDPHNLSIENRTAKVGIQYLFDGDTKGTKRATGSEYIESFTFIAGKEAVGKDWIITFTEPQIPARLVFYSQLPYRGFLGEIDGVRVINGVVENKLPKEVTVYGSNDKNEWTKIMYFLESHLVNQGSWADRAMTSINTTGKRYTTLAQLEAANPCFLKVESMMTSSTSYKYLKIVINQVLDSANTNPTVDQNPGRYVSFNELEVFVKKQ